MIGFLLITENSGWFRNELSWDGVIAALALMVAVIGPTGVLVWRWWRRHHPLTVNFSMQPYDERASEIADGEFAAFWETWLGSEKDVLLKISPHTETTFRNLRLRLVERKWLSGYRPWRWVPPDRSIVRITDMIDMRSATSSSPLYYFECDIEAPEGSFLGHYFNDHDYSRGVYVPSGAGLWVGVIIDAWQEWRGRLEIDTVVAGQRVFERKRFHVGSTAPAGKALFNLGVRTNKAHGRQALPSDEASSLQSGS